MATYNSAAAGNWNNDATWTEAGQPNANDDVVLITHAVAYNIGESALTWGNITLNSGGTLTFPTTASSTLVFNATGVLTINSGGKLACGTVGSPLGTAYTCKFHWPQGSSARYVMILNDGGEIAVFGNPAYYGSEKYAYLDSDWTTGQTLYVTGDFSSTWIAGQKFYIHKNAVYSNYLTDADIFIIGSVGAYDAGNNRTPITISEAAPGTTFVAVCNTYQSQLVMVSRNIEFADPGSTWGVGDFNSYTEMIRFDNNQAVGNELIDIRDVIFRGWDICVDGGYNFHGTNLIFLNNYCVINSGTNHQITGNFLSNNYGINSGTNHQITGNFLSNNYGINSGINHQITGNFLSNYRGINFGTNHQITGNFLSNNYGTNSGTNHQITGNFLSNNYGINSGINHQITGNFLSNNRGINSGTNHQITGNFLNNTTNVLTTSSTYRYVIILEDCILAGTDRQPIIIYQNSGNWMPAVTGDAHWQTPPSANSWILEAIPNSYCEDSYVNQMKLSPLDEMAVNAESGSQTLTFKIYPVGWTTALDQDDVVLKVRYLDTASGITRTTIVNSTATYANGAWRDLSVTYNPLQAGILYFQVYLKKYESACYMLIDPEPVVS